MMLKVKYVKEGGDGRNYALAWLPSTSLEWRALDMWGVNEEVPQREFENYIKAHYKTLWQKICLNSNFYTGKQYPGDRWGIVPVEWLTPEENEFGVVSP